VPRASKASPADKPAKLPAADPSRPPHDPTLRLLQVSVEGAPIDSGFEAYDLLKAASKKGLKFVSLPGDLPAYNALRLAQRDPTLGQSSLWGIFPPDFSRRTQMTATELKAVISSNPGFDLYYCSANPELEAVYHNPWRAPAVTYPDFIELSRAFLKASGIGEAPLEATCHSALFATGNLLIATPAIWSQYVAFADQAIAKAAANLGADIARALFEEQPQSGRLTHWALIVARLPSVFLMMRQSNFQAFKIPLLNQERALNPHLRVLREMKDIGLEQRSRWHVQSWMTYRGLYLAHVMGKEWVMRHIEKVTPKSALTALPVPKVSWPYPRSFQVDTKP
jgi:hypothetical protein